MKLKHIALATAAVAVSAGLIVARPGQPTILPTVPGAVNAAITQANIQDNICNPNWSTKSERPTSNYTTALKVKQLKALRWNDQKTGDFEEDHAVSLEIAGDPTSPDNLWPEKYSEPYGAHNKDKLENKLHSMICSGQISLVDAQTAIRTDWVAEYKKLGLDGPQFGSAIPINDPDDETQN